MATVEDAIIYLYGKLHGKFSIADEWSKKFIESLYNYVCMDKPLSTEQSRVFLKILEKYSSAISDDNILDVVKYPRYKNNPYKSKMIPNEVRYVGNNIIAFRFKKNDDIKLDLKRLSERNKKQEWMAENNRISFNSFLWLVPVTRDTLKDVIKIIGKYDFKFDDHLIEYLALADSSANQKSTFVVDPETGNIIGNICDNPILSSWITNILYGKLI